MPRLNLDQLSDKVQFTKADANKSQAWFSEQVRIIGGKVSPQSLMSNSYRRRDFLVPGQMVMYFYHPKGVDTLPYYDTFPLIIPFSQDAETFTGINFHYLPPKVRFALLKNLLDFANNRKLNEKTALRMSWEYIGGVSRYRGVNSAVKKYRFDHVQSQYLFVPATQWFNAIMLPTERFNTGPAVTYINKQTVWQDAMKYL
jgi:hypothetical protein